MGCLGGNVSHCVSFLGSVFYWPGTKIVGVNSSNQLYENGRLGYHLGLHRTDVKERRIEQGDGFFEEMSSLGIELGMPSLACCIYAVIRAYSLTVPSTFELGC